jgi:hypothetical protein
MQMRFALVAILLFSAGPGLHALSDCGLPRLAANSRAPTTFIYEKGWTIPGLGDASVVRTYQDEDGSEVIDYKPTESVDIDLQGFELSEDGQSIRLVPGYVQLVTEIIEHRVQERTYAYSVVTVSEGRADPPMWQQVRTATGQKTQGKAKGLPAGVLGCGWTVLRYFDADGDGRFRSLEYAGFGSPNMNSTHCPTTPEWVLKLLPNRAAAERCTKKVAARDLQMRAIPPVVRDLLEYRPPAPVLAPRN